MKRRIPRTTRSASSSRDLVDRAFGGSAAKLVVQALATKKASRQELAEIRKLLDVQKGGRR